MDVRRSEGRPRLRPGDVLLGHGEGAVSWGIRRFDESDVDRAAIALDADSVAEVSEAGLRRRPWEEVVAEGRFSYIRRLPNEADPARVADRARLLLSEPSRYVDRRLVSLAILAMTRRLPFATASLRAVVRGVLDRASELVDGVVAAGGSFLPSAQFVYRCFEESGDPRSSLSIMFPAVHPSSTLSRTGPGSGETTLIGWAIARNEPVVVPRLSSVETVADRELDASITAFAMDDGPQDAFVATSHTSVSRQPVGVVTDDELLVSAVRFRNQMNRFAVMADPDPWAAFRTAADLVTAGDLRYSPSLATVGSVRPEPRRAMIGG